MDALPELIRPYAEFQEELRVESELCQGLLQPVAQGKVLFNLSSSLNQGQFEKENGLTKNSIRRWFRIFGLEDKPSPVMSKKLSQTEQELHDRIYELEKKIKSLETELKRSNMARDAYDCMIDLAEKKYNIPVRKNSDAK